jgi:hypothetical protein
LQQLPPNQAEEGIPFFSWGSEVRYDLTARNHFDLAVALAGVDENDDADAQVARMASWYGAVKPRGGRFRVVRGEVDVLWLSEPMTTITVGTEFEPAEDSSIASRVSDVLRARLTADGICES